MAVVAGTSIFNSPDVRAITFFAEPYPHFECPDFLDSETADALLSWLEGSQWQPLALDGYEGYADISLNEAKLPNECTLLNNPDFLTEIRLFMARSFPIDSEGYVRVTAHRLLAGSSLTPHSDLSPLRFTHRLLVQLNRGWSFENGGLLCVYDENPLVQENANRKPVTPVHRSAFAFEVSERSFHSVTPVVCGERFTLSYTFYPPSKR